MILISISISAASDQVAAALQVAAYASELRRRVLASPAVRAELDALRLIASAFDTSRARLEASRAALRQLRCDADSLRAEKHRLELESAAAAQEIAMGRSSLAIVYSPAACQAAALRWQRVRQARF